MPFFKYIYKITLSMNTVPEDIVKAIFSFLDFKSHNGLSATALRYGVLDLSDTNVVLRTAYYVGTRN